MPSTPIPPQKKIIIDNGASYFFKGFSLIRQKGIRRFVFIPLFINILLFSYAFYYVYLELSTHIDSLMSWLPSWLNWLSVVLWPLAVLTVLVVFSFLFSTVANWLAAPFNGLLSEKMESILHGQPVPTGDMLDIVKDVPRTLHREWQKLVYYIPRALGFFIILWVLPVFGQIIWFLFVSWMMAIQYKDYPFDNHKIPFTQMKQLLKQNQSLSYSFGITVAVFSMIPIVNLLVMPVAICGATALWVDYYEDMVRSESLEQA
ncbi:sulfate transporter CysZ [Colwellia sp. E2M01]|uniref:sulfate transporter CysZ n=1 Tax=Colwellia sp. E2M01 TaxID=2841561 RepID=UPI001C08F25D|nr:sulfate transporter CysZ [Colwellia sp. E2M01]MBU2871739.1 sulfate transporter CysZ [Colwellia sp. E2M01]